MERAQKEQTVALLHETFARMTLVVVTRPVGLTVAEMEDLRRGMRDGGARFRVTKNRLTRLALEGTPFTGLSSLFVGPTAIAVSEDPVAAARVAVDYAKRNQKFDIVGAGLGQRVLDVEGVKALAALPSLDELRAKLVGLLNAPATHLAGVLQAPAGKLARVVNAYATKGESA